MGPSDEAGSSTAGSSPARGQETAGKQPESRRAAVGLLNLLVGAVTGAATAAIINDLTPAFERSPALLIAVLGGGALIACALYFLGDIRRGARRAWHRLRARTRSQRGRRPQVSPILSPQQLLAAADADQQPGTAPSYRWRIIAGVVAATALGFLVGYWAIGDGFAHGQLPGTSTVAGVAVLVAAIVAWARYRGPARLSWLRPWRNSMLAIGVAALGLSAGGTLGAADLTRPVPCPPPTELRVLASTEILGPLQAAITEFERDEQTVLDASCYAIDITAYSADSDKAADDGITGSWQLSTGPEPDIWIADSIEEVSGTSLTGPGQPQLHTLGSIASSPIVIAVPTARVTLALRASAQDASLAGIDQAVSAGFTLQVPNPKQSETARLGIAGLYQDLGTASLRPLVSGSHPSDSDGLLCQATPATPAGGQPGPTRPAAYLVSEVAVFASEPGHEADLASPACTGQQSTPQSLTSFQPVTGPVLDFPFTTVTWHATPSAQAAAKATAEQDFYRWLLSGPGVAALKNNGLDAPAQPANLPPASDINAAVNGFSQTQPPARILVAIDDSQPMRLYLGPITRAVGSVLGQEQGGSLSSRDSFGIWTFPGSGDATTRQSLSLLPNTSAHRAQVAPAVAGITAHGHSAEFDLTYDAALALNKQAPSPSTSALVLLTDGDNQQTDTGGNDIGRVRDLLDALAPGGSPIKVDIIAFGTQGCAETPSGSAADSLTDLAKAGGGNCTDAASEPLQQELTDDIGALSTGG